MPRLLILISNGGFFLSHRLALAIEAKAAGYEVAVACPHDESAAHIVNRGLRHIPFTMRRKGSNPFSELATIASIRAAIRAFRPDVIHQITAKPVIYGGVLARLSGIPTVSAISGLGYVFINRGAKVALLRSLVVAGFRMAVSGKRAHLIFQNGDDLATFRRLRIFGHGNVTMIAGSGADLAAIRPRPLPEGRTVVILPARLLRDKGVVEFVEAARMLKTRGVDATFRLLGDPDAGNPTSVTPAELSAWQAEGVIEWQPFTSDIDTALAQAHVVALPSYREGFPKTLIDAAAAGRAAAASDVPGCRDAIVEGETGVLFRVRDAAAMADALGPLIADRAMQARMGEAARRHAEARFDVREVCREHIAIYDRLARRGQG